MFISESQYRRGRSLGLLGSVTTSSCEYFHLVVVMVVMVVMVVVVLVVVRQSVREDVLLWEGQKLLMSETVAARLLLADIKS